MAVVVLGLGTTTAAAAVTEEPSGGEIRLVSVRSNGAQADAGSASPVISANGRYVAFTSEATNLVRKDTNRASDVFVHDRKTHVTRRVSVATNGTQGNDRSYTLDISANGRFVAYMSWASNLVPGDTNQIHDVFVRDRLSGVTERVSIGSGGSQADDGSAGATISARGRFVAFWSFATNLVAGDDNEAHDVFVRDRRLGLTERVSVSSAGNQANALSLSPQISARGRYVAFESHASNLVAKDSNVVQDVFVHDRHLGVTERVSVGPDGGQAADDSGSPVISARGRYVAFESYAPNLVTADTNEERDVFVRDRVLDVTRRVSVGANGNQANRWSAVAAISAKGRFVIFESPATNLVVDDTQRYLEPYVRDRANETTEPVVVGRGGAAANDGSYHSAVSAHGRYVAFQSNASNLVADDTNKSEDVFLVDRLG